MDYHIDAKHKPLGRIASEIAGVLQGKKSARYEPRLAGGDRAIVKNYKLIAISGDKARSKVYYRHTGYMGHLKEKTFQEAFGKDPKKVLRETVRHMLPKNSLAPKRLKNLVFTDDGA